MSKTALITGASSGIGYAFSELLAQEGYDLVVIARDRERLSVVQEDLEKKYHVKVHVIAQDLSLAQSPVLVFKELEKKQIRIHLLINNAGCGFRGAFLAVDWERELAMMQLNMVNLVHLTRLIVPQMIEEKSGGVINVASIAGFVPGPLMAIYYATKAFVLSFSQALARELKNSGITVTTLCPGLTRTMFDAITENNKTWRIASAENVARFGYRAFLKGRGVVVYGFINTLSVLGSRFLPAGFVANSIYKIQKSRLNL